MRKPIIGIVSNNECIEKGNYYKPVNYVNDDYLNMLYDCGGIPIIIPSFHKFNQIKDFLCMVDGLLLIGGEDVSSKCYEGKKSKNVRDNFEIEIYNFFKKNKKPVLGICRGLQIINVAEGGTLKDIVTNEVNHKIEKDGWINYHEIRITPGTKLEKLLKKKSYTISSLHHQSIEKLGGGLIISAVASDGVIEGIEYSGDTFIIALQGHIEKILKNYKAYTNVIKEFIKEANNG